MLWQEGEIEEEERIEEPMCSREKGLHLRCRSSIAMGTKLECLNFSPRSASKWLCDLGKAASPLCATLLKNKMK